MSPESPVPPVARVTATLVRVTGRVQGVGFRWWVQVEAERRGLRGWVQNDPDGAVSALLIGAEAQVAAMLDALRGGPPGARVAAVETSPAADDHSPDFRIAR